MTRSSPPPTPIRQIIERSFEGRKLARVLVEAAILSRWVEAVGPKVAARARPDGLKEGLLTVRVSSSPWMAELSFLKPKLLERINAALGAPAGAPVVADLRLVCGPLPAEAKPPVERPALRPLSPEEGRLVEAITAEVRDPLLRDSIARALGRALAQGPLPAEGAGSRGPADRGRTRR